MSEPEDDGREPRESPAGGVLAGRFPARRRIALLALLGARAAMAGRDAARPLDLRDLGAPSFTSFTPRDGVPDSVVTAIASGRDGFVWLASPLGLARYDGHRWEAVAAREASGQLGDLFVDHAGTLWAAFDDRGIASFDGARWHLENRASGLPSDHFHRVVETKDAAGRIETWALSGDLGLLRRDGGRWQPDPGNGQLPVGPLNGIAKTRDIGGAERLWVATYNEGLWYRENGGRWTRLLVTGFDPGQVDDLLITRSHGREELWIATYGLGLWRLTRDGLQLVGSELPDPPPSIVYALAASGEAEGDRVVWAATRGGLVRVHGDAVQVFDQRHGLPSSVIRNLHVGKSPGGAEVLWLATERGVARTPVGSTPWRTASLMGAGGNGVFGVLVEPDGRGGERLWVAASHDGVGLYEDGRWRRFDERDGSLPSSNVRLVTRVPDETGGDALWIGFTGGELVRVHEGTPGTFRFERIATPWPKHEGQAVTDLFARNTGGRHERWVATRQSGIWCFSDGRWTSFRPDRVVGQWRVSKFAEQLDRDGRSWIWATTNQGLARWDGTVWTLLGAEVGLPDLELLGLTLMPDEKGRPLLWVGTTRNGLLRMDVSDPKNPEILSAGGLPKPPNPSAYNAQRDSKGRIYVCTNNGVQLLVPDGRGGFRERVFTRGDGLVHEECNNNAQRIDAHDRYWMGNLGGLSVYDPAELSSRPHAAPLRLTHVRIDGADVDPAAVRLRPTARELRVEFALLSWQREAESLFRSRLVGYDPQPEPWTAQNFRVFGTLPPGRHVLLVEARDYAGIESAPLELPIDVMPAWWQRLSFRIAVIAFFAFAGPLFYLRRVRRLSRQKAELERVVAARTAELGAANERLAELSLQDPLTGVANRRRLDAVLDEEWRRAVRLKTPLSFLLLDIDHFKAYNDRLGHQAGDACLRSVASAVAGAHTRAGEFVARYGGEEFAVLIPGIGAETALVSAENARRRVLELAVPHPSSAVSPVVSVSVGVASIRPADGASPADLVAAADRALYRAKAEGRNRVAGG